jgi:hypothetical protein
VQSSRKFRSAEGTHTRKRRATPEPQGDGQSPHARDTPAGEETVEAVVTRSPAARLAGIVAVTTIEAASIYAWLRLDDAGKVWWGLLALVAGEMLETQVLTRFVDRGGRQRWGRLSPAAAGSAHLRGVQRRIGIAGNAETAIWVLWLACAVGLSQPIAAAGLLVAMHLKHQVEVAAVRDLPYRNGLFSPTALLGSAMEVAGA